MKRFFKALGKAILYLLIYFGIQLVVSFAAVIVMVVHSMSSGNQDMLSVESDLMAYSTVIILISNSISLICVWVLFKLRKKSLTTEIQLYKCSIKKVLIVTLFGCGYSFVSSWALGMIPFPESMMESFKMSHDTLSLGNPIVNFISVGILGPIVEEVFFRGLIYTRLKEGMSTIVAAILSAIMFGVMHGEIIWMLHAFVVGLVFVWVFEKTKSLLPCIVIHVVNNSISQLTENMPETSAAVEWLILAISIVLVVSSVICLGGLEKKQRD